VVEAALKLVAGRPSEAVTVAEIARAAGMTSAAVYYHYASKDEILLEGLREFGEALVAHVATLQRQVSRGTFEVTALPAEVLRWLDEHRDAATVYFIGSAGLTLQLETLRRDIHADLVTSLTTAARAARKGLPGGEAAVIGVGLFALIDASAGSWLRKDDLLQAMGVEGFLAQTEQLAARIVGL
jgi:AcrR family transcriptional regulator